MSSKYDSWQRTHLIWMERKDIHRTNGLKKINGSQGLNPPHKPILNITTSLDLNNDEITVKNTIKNNPRCNKNLLSQRTLH